VSPTFWEYKYEVSLDRVKLMIKPPSHTHTHTAHAHTEHAHTHARTHTHAHTLLDISHNAMITCLYKIITMPISKQVDKIYD
jgi:hypothetical protein